MEVLDADLTVDDVKCVREDEASWREALANDSDRALVLQMVVLCWVNDRAAVATMLDGEAT
jgi:hypothetical protein